MSQSELNPIRTIVNQVTLVDYLEKVLHYRIPRLPFSVSCPLHKDNKPSMRLYPEDRNGYCFSCGKHYTSFEVHKQLNGLSNKDTIAYFAREFNLDLSKSYTRKVNVNSLKIAQKCQEVAKSKITNNPDLDSRRYYFNLLQSRLVKVFGHDS